MNRKTFRRWVSITSVAAFGAVSAFAEDPSAPGVGHWPSFGNGPGHSGFYPGTLGAASPVPGWTKSFSPVGLNQVAISEGRVFVSSSYDGFSHPPGDIVLAALDVTTGAELWRRSGTFFSAPTVSEGHLFLLSSYVFHTLRVSDGTTEWERPELRVSPVALGDLLWAGEDTVAAQIRISDNTKLRALNYGLYGGRLSLSSGYLYLNNANYFAAADAETGRSIWGVSTSSSGSGTVLDGVTPVVAGDKAAFVVDDNTRLVAVDLTNRTVLWSVKSTNPYPFFAFSPANDFSTIYAVDGAGVNAHAASNGQLLGRYDFSKAPPSTYKDPPFYGSQPIVTNDAVIVATRASTFIFDKATFQLRTELPVGGFLSYAAGVLYVADGSGKLSTFRFPDAVDPPPAPLPTPPPPLPEPKTNVELVSINRQGSGTGDANSNLYSVARAITRGTGRFVLFTSKASDLTDIPDTNGVEDLFVRDLQGKKTELISVNAAGTATGKYTGGAVSIAQACITPDGRFVAFDSLLTDLDASDADSTNDIFVRDLQTHQTSAISVAPNGAPVGGTRPFISANGRWVMFTSYSSQLAPGSPAGTNSVFVRDRQTNETTRVSFDNNGAPLVDAVGRGFTPDGRFVLFQAPVDSFGTNQLYLRDLQTQKTQLIPDLIFGLPNTGYLRMSEDGRIVLFESKSAGLVAFDSVLGTSTYINQMGFGNARLGDMTADGMVIGFFTDASSSQGFYIWDRRTGETKQVLAPNFLPTTAVGTTGMRISRTGRFVAYQTYLGVYLLDRQLRMTVLVSHNFTNTGPSDRDAAIGDMTDDGQTVLFQSSSTDLVDLPDFNNKPSVGSLDVFVASIPTTGGLLNISTRGLVGPDDNTLIGGFVVAGTAPKKIMVRALGPSLLPLGIANAVADPRIELYSDGGTLLASNDNWGTNQAEIAETGIPPANDLESALVRSLDPGAYTVVARSNGNAGIGVVELYDLEQASGERLANISTRGFVGAGDNAMIAGFIAGGSDGGSANVLVRGLGPTLANFGVSGALADPTLELRDSNGALVGANDDWRATQLAEITATGISPGNDSEAALLARLAPGPYTAIVRGKDSSTGVALVEVYHFK